MHRDAILGYSLKEMDAQYMVVSDDSLTSAMDQYTKWLDQEVVFATFDQTLTKMF